MPLKFRGPPILNPTKGSVRFTGYPEGAGDTRVIVCQVTRGALESLTRNPTLTADGMLGIYNAHIAVIRAAANALFDSGSDEPHISEETLKNR